ncbi:MAG: VWA domain-containing protein [Pirellulaceae bacterium]|nr:VWA domain-containing protein [Pirellulaceae bacterium]
MPRLPPLFAFLQLGSGWMLLWGLAATLPILIHLWSRRRFREESWAAMEFLLAAMRKNAKRIQLEQWLLLAVRTAILLLLALALADPQLSLLSALAGAASGGQTHVVLVIDSSFSMDFRREGKSRFDAARELARQLVADGQQGDGYTLVLMGQPPRVIISEPAFDPADVREELENLRLPHSGASLPATLAEVETLLRKAAEHEPRLAQRRVIFFTDLQQTTWGEVNSADCRERLARLDKLAVLHLVDLGEVGSNNLAVARLEASQPVVTKRAEVTLSAELVSFSRQDMPRQAVEIVVDGKRIADERIDLPAGGRATISATHRFEAPGEHVVEAKLAEDSLPLDNHRWLSVPVREAVRVLAIGGRPNETRHLALALQPERGARGATQVTAAPESALVETDLSEYDCVILANIGRFSREEAGVLRAYLWQGGGIITVLGDQVQAESYNQQLASDDPALRVLPARLGETVAEAQYRLNPLDYRHPVVAPFRGHETAGLLTTPIWKYIRLAPFPAAKVALGFDGGDPALVEERIGRGRSILLATAASPDSLDRSTTPPTPWTAISSWPSFPPLVQEMLNLAISGRNEGRNIEVGDDLTGLVAGAAADARVELVGPSGDSDSLPLVADGTDARWTEPAVSISGLFEARLPGSAPPQRFAVNVNIRESDLARFDAESLPSPFGRDSQLPGEAPAAFSRTGESSYFRLLLWGVLILLLVDPCLAWHFGRGRG